MVQQALTTQLVHDVDELRQLEGDRLDALQVALWPAAGRGDLGAAMAVLKVMEQRAKLFNLYRHESAEERLWGMVRSEKATQRRQHDGDEGEDASCPAALTADNTPSRTVSVSSVLEYPLASPDTPISGVDNTMAQRTRIELVDDLDGTVLDEGDGETVTFSLTGVSYEIDLSRSNAEALRSVLEPYITAGRRVGGSRGGRGSSTGAGTRDYDPKAVRKWAESNGVDVPARGRIPADILERYKAEGN